MNIQFRDYPKIRMNQDPTATKTRQILADWLRPGTAKVSKVVNEIFYNRLRDMIKLAQYTGAIDPACESILYLYSFKSQRKADGDGA